VPPPEARELAIAATRALGVDFAGVDLLPDREGWVVLEVNGAVDVRDHYAPGSNVFADALDSLERLLARPLLVA
jgi:glutathione synthase/RimK-type ligase-like ATP-grasp enzyme